MVILSGSIKERAHADYTALNETQVRTQTSDNNDTFKIFMLAFSNQLDN